MIISIILALTVAIFWSLGEVNYSKLSKSTDSHNVYFYQYMARTIIYLSVVLFLKPVSFTTFSLNHFIIFLPVIMCDLFGSYVINIAVKNGKLSVVSPIMAAYPIIDILFGIIILNEKISILELILVMIITISIIILASTQKIENKKEHPTIGIFFAIVYMILIAMSTFFEKNAYIGNLQIFELYYYKGIIYFFTSLYFLYKVKKYGKVKRLNKEIVKGTAITSIGNVLYSFSLTLGNISIIAPISSMYSVFSNYMSRKVLNEKPSTKDNLCIFAIIICTLILITLTATK